MANAARARAARCSPRGVHATSVGALLHEQPDVDRVKAVDVLARDRRRRRRAARRRGPSPSAAATAPGCRRCRRRRSAVRPAPARRRAIGRRRQPERSARQPGLGHGLDLVAHVDLRGRVVAGEHDAEAGRPAGRGREGRHARRQFLANRRRQRGPVESVSRVICLVISADRPPAAVVERLELVGLPEHHQLVAGVDRGVRARG